ncbi:hypothetical protein VTN00DRAFT_7135 [Thermoascus crustaceus]|uniref:uncharacterized protein n=1 Tax=Thermoascus crustaceus TaxID=5088 RepID=UPI003743B09C
MAISQPSRLLPTTTTTTTTTTHTSSPIWHHQHQHQPLTKSQVYRTSRAKLSMALPVILLVAIAGFAGFQWMGNYLYRSRSSSSSSEGSVSSTWSTEYGLFGILETR